MLIPGMLITACALTFIIGFLVTHEQEERESFLVGGLGCLTLILGLILIISVASSQYKTSRYDVEIKRTTTIVNDRAQPTDTTYIFTLKQK
jgi:hypothetical protein